MAFSTTSLILVLIFFTLTSTSPIGKNDSFDPSTITSIEKFIKTGSSLLPRFIARQTEEPPQVSSSCLCAVESDYTCSCEMTFVTLYSSDQEFTQPSRMDGSTNILSREAFEGNTPPIDRVVVETGSCLIQALPLNTNCLGYCTDSTGCDFSVDPPQVATAWVCFPTKEYTGWCNTHGRDLHDSVSVSLPQRHIEARQNVDGSPISRSSVAVNSSPIDTAVQNAAMPRQVTDSTAEQTCTCEPDADCSCDPTTLTFQSGSDTFQYMSLLIGEFSYMPAPYSTYPIDNISASAGVCVFFGHGPDGSTACLPSCSDANDCSISLPQGTTVLGWGCWPGFPVGLTICEENSALEDEDGSVVPKNGEVQTLQIRQHACRCPDNAGNCNCDSTVVTFYTGEMELS